MRLDPRYPSDPDCAREGFTNAPGHRFGFLSGASAGATGQAEMSKSAMISRAELSKGAARAKAHGPALAGSASSDPHEIRRSGLT